VYAKINIFSIVKWTSAYLKNKLKSCSLITWQAKNEIFLRKMNFYNMNQYNQVTNRDNLYCEDQENISQLKRGSFNKQVHGSNKKLKSIENTINSGTIQISYSLAKFEYRNERERKRVERVNTEFRHLEERLQNANLIELSQQEKENYHSKSRGLSKVKILRLALKYIKQLNSILEADSKMNVLQCKCFKCLLSNQDIFYLNNYENFF
jgi:hypothetical protein